MKKLLFSALFLAMLGLAANVDARTTRDLVFEDDDDTAAATSQAPEASGKQTIAIKTTVVLTRDGQKSTVTPSHEFKSGDKVQLVFTPSIDGYVYWMAKGSSGSYTMLYPNAKAGMDNQVKRNQEYTVPMRGGFKFDDTPGNEELLCVLSPTRLPDMDKAAEEQFKNGTKEVAQLEESNASKRKTRDLVFEDDDEEDVNTKKQEAAAGEPLVANFTLVHK